MYRTSGACVCFFRPHKNIVKFTIDTVLVTVEKLIFSTETTFCLTLQFFVRYQFSALRLQNIIRFAFFKCDYVNTHPGYFQTPLEYCFESGLIEECCGEDCDEAVFIKRAHRGGYFCLGHLII